MTAILLTLIFIRPFISSLAFPFANFAFSICFMLFLAFSVIYCGIPKKGISPLKYPLIFFCLSLLISTVFSFDKVNSFGEIYKYANGLLLFMVIRFLREKDKTLVIRTIVLTGFAISLIDIYQYFFGFQHLFDYITRNKITDSFIIDYTLRKRVYMPFVTPNILAGYLILVIPFILIVKDKFKWVVFVCVLFALLLTKSLGAYLSLFLGMGIYLYLKKELPDKKFTFLWIISIALIAAFLLRQTTAKEHAQPGYSLAMRLSYWKDTLSIIRSHPLLGIGPGNFNLALSRYAHNSYLQIWAEIGVLGLISLLWIIISALKLGLKSLKDSQDKNIIICLITTNIIFVIHNVFDFSLFLPEINIIWWLTLGLLISYSIKPSPVNNPS